MKRILVALSLAALAAPVLAAEVSVPFEQTQFDRNVQNASASAGATSAKENVWAEDYNFIAPAQ